MGGILNISIDYVDREDTPQHTEMRKKCYASSTGPGTKFAFFKNINIVSFAYKTALPFVSVVENDDETVIFTAFGCRVDVRTMLPNKSIRHLQSWPLLDSELITCMDVKRKEFYIHF